MTTTKSIRKNINIYEQEEREKNNNHSDKKEI